MMVRHGDDHVHLVVSRVDFEGQLWSRSHDRRKAQNAASALEDAYGLEKAPRTHQTAAGRQSRALVHEQQRQKAQELEALQRQAQELGALRSRLGELSAKAGEVRLGPVSSCGNL